MSSSNAWSRSRNDYNKSQVAPHLARKDTVKHLRGQKVALTMMVPSLQRVLSNLQRRPPTLAHVSVNLKRDWPRLKWGQKDNNNSTGQCHPNNVLHAGVQLHGPTTTTATRQHTIQWYWIRKKAEEKLQRRQLSTPTTDSTKSTTIFPTPERMKHKWQ